MGPVCRAPCLLSTRRRGEERHFLHKISESPDDTDLVNRGVLPTTRVTFQLLSLIDVVEHKVLLVDLAVDGELLGLRLELLDPEWRVLVLHKVGERGRVLEFDDQLVVPLRFAHQARGAKAAWDLAKAVEHCTQQAPKNSTRKQKNEMVRRDKETHDKI